MNVQLRSLRVTADMDSANYVQGANAKVAADDQMVAGARRVSVALADTEQKVSRAGSPVERLSRQYVDGYGAQQKFEQGLRQLNTAMDKGQITGERAQAVYAGMVQRLGLVASGAEITTRGYDRLGAVITEVNQRLAAQQTQVIATTGAMARLNAVNDNEASFRRRNLSYQLFDVGQMAALGQNPAMTALQQGPQIAQLYAGAGGMKAALSDASALAGTLVTRLGPVALAAGAGYAAIAQMRSEIEKSTGNAVTFGETFKTVIGIIADDVSGVFQPALDAIGPAALYAFDKLSSAAVDIAELIINSFTAAYEDVKFLWNQFPNVIGAAVTGGANAMITGVMAMVEAVSDTLDSWIDKINEKLGALGVNIPTLGYDAGDLTIPNSYLEDLLKATDERNATIERIMSRQPLRDYVKSVTERASEQLSGPRLPDGKAGGSIPIPQFRGIDDIPGEQEYMQDFQKSSEARLRQIEAERDAIGMIGAALEAYRFEQEAINAALSKNIQLGPEQLAIIRQQAEAYGKVAEALSRARLADNLQFERDQLFRSDMDGLIASTQRGAGLPVDLNDSTAQYIRMNELLKEQKAAWEDIRSTGKGAIADIVSSAVGGFKNIEDVIANIAGNMAQMLAELAITNPLTNSIYGGNAPTLDSLGGLGGIFSALMGGEMPKPAGLGATQAVASMNVQAAMVSINGTAVGGDGGALGAITKLLNPANSNAANLNANYSPGAVARSAITAGGAYGNDLVSNIKALAGNIGANPRDVAALMSFESNLKPDIWGGSGGRHYGLIQAGPSERSTYGITPGGSLADQFKGIEAYFKDRGYKPGMSGLDLYSTVNAGRPGLHNRSDTANGGTWGTVADKWNSQMGPHFDKADALLGSSNEAAAGLDKLTTSSATAVNGLQAAGKGMESLGGGFENMAQALMNVGGGEGGGGWFSNLMKMFGGAGGALSFMNGISPLATTDIASGSWGLFDTGGYTGSGGRKDPAGIVHRGEVVFSQDDIARNGGVAAVEAMRRGNARFLGSSQGNSGPAGKQVQFNQNIHNYAGVDIREERSEDEDGGIRSDVYIERRVAAAINRPGSAADKALAARGAKRKAVRR
ncbi:phage tail length tape measure family protein [Corticibacterium sp. UT-5YL-CI-8]|nr:phage tail length tape measure family protein [Tianweitania sp. UT-5YL-CI-8]